MFCTVKKSPSVQPPTRTSLQAEFQRSERDLLAVQTSILVLLVILLAYGGTLIYERDWTALVPLLPPVTAACAAMLVAKTATRLLTYNILVRADDRTQDIVRVTHHSLAIINDLRGRVQYMKLALVEGKRPLVAITQNAEALQRRYETLYDRDLYRYLPGETINAITNLSGSIFGISALVAGISSLMDDKGHLNLPPTESGTRNTLSDSFSRLESELDALYSQFETVRASAE